MTAQAQAHLVSTGTGPEVLVGEVELLDAEGAKACQQVQGDRCGLE